MKVSLPGPRLRLQIPQALRNSATSTAVISSSAGRARYSSSAGLRRSLGFGSGVGSDLTRPGARLARLVVRFIITDEGARGLFPRDILPFVDRTEQRR